MNVYENRDVMSFWKEYKLIASTESMPGRIKGARKCRFCGKEEGAVQFKSKAHAVPELLGRNEFLIFDECDACNGAFSEIEMELSKLFLPYLTFVGVRGKRKIPEFHSRIENGNTATRTVMKKERTGNVNIEVNEAVDIRVDEASNQLSILFRQGQISRFKVYKALVKIALSLIPPAEVEEYRILYDWLLDHRHSLVPAIPHACVTVMKKVKWEKPGAYLYESRKNPGSDETSVFPRFSLVLYFANVAVQIFMFPLRGRPILPGEAMPELVLNSFPAFVHDKVFSEDFKNLNLTDIVNIDYQVSLEDLGEEEYRERNEIIEFQYDGRITHGTP